MSLTDVFIKNLKPQEKPKKYFDGGGLNLYHLPAGGKSLLIDYRILAATKLLF